MEILEKPAVMGSQVTLTEAEKWTADYAENCEAGDIKSLTISADHLRKILAQPDCEYVRFYVGLTNPGNARSVGLPAGHSLIVIGVDSEENNIKKSNFDTMVFENLSHCPPDCSGGGGGMF